MISDFRSGDTGSNPVGSAQGEKMSEEQEVEILVAPISFTCLCGEGIELENGVFEVGDPRPEYTCYECGRVYKYNQERVNLIGVQCSFCHANFTEGELHEVEHRDDGQREKVCLGCVKSHHQQKKRAIDDLVQRLEKLEAAKVELEIKYPWLRKEE